MIRPIFWMAIGWLVAAGIVAAEEPAANVGATFAARNGFELKLLLDRTSLGTAEVELAELLFPAGADSGDHAHGVTEIFYVLSGELEHVVNGHSTFLKPGMVGHVRPPDHVRHKTTSDTRVLVIWVPGGEAGRIIPRLKRRDVEAVPPDGR